MTITIPKIEGEVDISELTTVNSDGVFDKMFGTLRNILREEYDANRIRGTDYANALVRAFGDTLQMASTYTISKAKLPFEVQLLEGELAKIAADVAVTTKQGALIDAQASQVMAEINRINSEVTYKLPTEVELLSAQVSKVIADTSNTLKEGNLIEANICKVKEETVRIHADTALKLPEEVALLKKQTIQAAAQTDLTKAQANLVEYDITYKSPKELQLLEQDILLKQSAIQASTKDLLIKEQQLELARTELALKAEQLKLSQYELKFKLPAEVDLTQAQADLYEQKIVTEKAQVDDTVADSNSTIGLNNQLLKEQAKGFVTDSQLKALSLLVETWKVRYNTDPDNLDNVVDDVNKLYDPNIGKAVDTVFNSLGIT